MKLKLKLKINQRRSDTRIQTPVFTLVNTIGEEEEREGGGGGGEGNDAKKNKLYLYLQDVFIDIVIQNWMVEYDNEQMKMNISFLSANDT